MPSKEERRDLYLERSRQAEEEYGSLVTMLEGLEPYYYLDYEIEHTEMLREGIEHVCMPWGTNAIDLVHDLLSVAGYSLSVPSMGPEKSHRSYAETQERYIQTVFDESERMQGQDLLSRAAMSGAMRGVVVGRAIHAPKWLERVKGEDGKYTYDTRVKGKIPIVVQLRDPLEVFPVFGRDGLMWVVESQQRRLRDIRQTYGKDILPDRKDEDQLIRWLEYWDDEEYCYWADNEPVKMGAGRGVVGPWAHRYGGIPYSYQFCRQTLSLEPDRRVRPLLVGLTGLIERSDLLDSMQMTFISTYIGSPITVKMIGPEKPRVSLKPRAINYIQVQESIDALFPGRTPVELQEMMQQISAHFERGTFPGSMYGTDPGRVMAGYAIAMLNQAGQARLNPIIHAIERCIASLGEKVLMISENYIQNKILERPIPFFYYLDEKDENTGQLFRARKDMLFDASKLEGAYRVESKLGEVMPADKAANMSLAQAARSGGTTGRPLLSDSTILEKYAIVDSASDEKQRIDEEIAESSPELSALSRAIAIARLREDYLDELNDLGVDIEATLAQIQAGQPVTAPMRETPLPGQLPMEAMPGAGPDLLEAQQEAITPQAVGNSMQAVGNQGMVGLPPTMPRQVAEDLGFLPPEQLELEDFG